MSNFTNPTSILPNLTNWCPISVQTISIITLNDQKMENKPNDVQNLQTLYQRKVEETRNTAVPLPWSKSCCGGRKTRSNRRPNLFLSYLSNVEESAKKNHWNEFRGSRNGVRKVWVGLEWPKNEENRRPTVAAAAAFAGPIRGRPTAIGGEIWPARSPRLAPPPWPARVQGWWPESSPTTKTRLA